MYGRRKTRTPVYVHLSERRLRQIDALVESWSYEIRLFVLRQLRQFEPRRTPFLILRAGLRRLLFSRDKGFQLLQDPEQLNDWRRRFKVSGSQNARAAWEKILLKELDWHDYQYLVDQLEKRTSDIYVPEKLIRTFDRLYHAHILKEYSEEADVPRAPLVLVVGGSGSGKTATVAQAIEEAIFRSEVRPKLDLKAKQREVLANEPIWRSLEDIDPELAVRIERRRKVERLRLMARLPLVKYLFRERIAQALSVLEEQGVEVDYAVITPNDYQTAWSGEPGNYLRKAMGDPRRCSIRHLEEAHSAFGRPEMLSTANGQQGTLIDSSNILLDEIVNGRRDCLLIATSDRTELFDPSIYRRFVERGLVIDISELWEDPANLREVVRRELRRRNFRFGPSGAPRELDEAVLDSCVERLYPIFQERSLRITPAYVRRLIDSLITLKGDFHADLLADQLLVRNAFKAVARNVYGSLYKKVVGQMERNVRWNEYIGGIKNEFSEMANNALFYNISDEKGVVLTGPPGSGKTFMVRAWLGDNREVQDLAVKLNDLSDPNQPLEGMVENLERVYDIAKMLSPAMVFFDEGDAVAPRRSPQGGSPYDKVTNTFLSIIDGESPLSRVFTVLTTNRLDIIDPALIRSKRLKVLNVSGHLREEDALRIVTKELQDIPLASGMSYEEMVRVAQNLCETPADFTAFAEKVRSLRNTEVEVMSKLLRVVEGSEEDRSRFVRFNYKTLLGLLEGAEGTAQMLLRARQGEEGLLELLDDIAERFRPQQASGIFPVTRWHLQAARAQLAESPMRKGKQQLEEFLETELSREPQVGFVVGVGANETSGMLLPIASALVYRMFPEKLLVTGAVSTTAPGAGELDMAVQMTRQSAQEALTLVENYLQELSPELNVTRLLGEFLDGYTIHHQMLSASYSVGGPSAGFALAINTLSVLLQLPVFNDFGITGAPWIKGAQTGEVGASVIIGGHRKKAEKVLQYLPRMYMPLQNYQDIEPEVLEAYRIAGRDIRGVRSFSALVPEVLQVSPLQRQRFERFHLLRIERDLKRGAGEGEGDEARLAKLERELRQEVEGEIRRRMQVIARTVRTGEAFASLAGLFAADQPAKAAVEGPEASRGLSVER